LRDNKRPEETLLGIFASVTSVGFGADAKHEGEEGTVLSLGRVRCERVRTDFDILDEVKELASSPELTLPPSIPAPDSALTCDLIDLFKNVSLLCLFKEPKGPEESSLSDDSEVDFL